MKPKTISVRGLQAERGRVQRMCDAALDENPRNHHFLYGALQTLNWVLRRNSDQKQPAAGAPSSVFRRVPGLGKPNE